MARGLFAHEDQLRKIDSNGDPLVKINQFVHWELFRPELEAAMEKARAAERVAHGKPAERTSTAGRPAIDVILLFKMSMIQSLYNLSEAATEQLVLDRLSFQRFVGLQLGDAVPDANTLWLFNQALVPGDLGKVLFRRFGDFLRNNGYEAQQGQIVDATIVRSRVRRDKAEVNEQIKNGDGKNVTAWSETTRRQKDIDARWTKKRNKSYFGYKDHESIDVQHKLIRDYAVTDASVHDSNVYEELITPNDSPNEYADSAYGSEKRLAARIADEKVPYFQEKGTRGHPLTEEQKQANREKSKTRSRIEHGFGVKVQRARDMVIRVVGIGRAKVKVGLRNLAYNIDRYAMLMRRKLAVERFGPSILTPRGQVRRKPPRAKPTGVNLAFDPTRSGLARPDLAPPCPVAPMCDIPGGRGALLAG